MYRPIRRLMESAKVFDKNRYDWYVYRGVNPIKVMYRNKPVVIAKGDAFAVRDATSSPGNYRLVTKATGMSRVMTPSAAVVNKLLAASKPTKAIILAAHLEEASPDWWNDLTLSEKKLYLSAHPGSKFAKRIAGESKVARRKLAGLSASAKNSIDNWNNKPLSEKMASTKDALAHAAQRAVKHSVNHLKHEAHMYKHAGAAVGHLARGKKWSELEPHHKKSLRNAIIHAGLTAGSMALGDPTGGAHSAVSNILAEFAHAHAHHALTLGAGEVGLKTGRDFLKKAVAADVSEIEKQKLAKVIAKIMVEARIPASEWVAILHEIEKRLKATKEQSSIGIAYHGTGLPAAVNIMESGAFNLASSIGTNSENQGGIKLPFS